MISKEMNNLFFAYSMIEKVLMESKEKQSYVINNIEKEKIKRLYEDIIDTLFEVCNSWIEIVMDNYNSSFYYETPEYHLACYEEGKVLFS